MSPIARGTAHAAFTRSGASSVSVRLGNRRTAATMIHARSAPAKASGMLAAAWTTGCH